MQLKNWSTFILRSTSKIWLECLNEFIRNKLLSQSWNFSELNELLNLHSLQVLFKMVTENCTIGPKCIRTRMYFIGLGLDRFSWVGWIRLDYVILCWLKFLSVYLAFGILVLSRDHFFHRWSFKHFREWVQWRDLFLKSTFVKYQDQS
jgi:hypothetical protein